jgi:hypothetical protein
MRTILSAVFAMALLLIVFPCTNAQAASSTGYVMAGENSYTFHNNRAVTNASVGGYKVKIEEQKLCVRKGSGSWKTIVSNSRMDSDFTTNGQTIYYSLYYGGKTTVYSISVNGKNNKAIKTFSSFVEVCYRYGDKLFLNDWDNMTSKYYSLSTGKVTTIKKDYRIYNVKKQYAVIKSWTTGGEACIGSIYTYNASSGKRKQLTSKAQDYFAEVSGNRLYYVYWATDAGYGKQQTFQVKSCKLNGTDYKNHTAKFKAMSIYDMTTKYVQYQKTTGGKVYKLTFS